MKLEKTVLGILALALLPVATVMLFGYGGYEFRQQAASWLDLRELWQSGQWHPGWDPHASFLLGDARFCYYPPVSLMVGAGLALLLPFTLVPAVFLWLTTAASGLSMYFACGDFVAAQDRWKAALLYMLSPYLLTTVLVRFAAGEALTLIWLPMTMLYFYRAVWLHSRRATMLLGCLLGLTWITSVPSSVVLLYVLSFATIVLALLRRSWQILPVPLFAECIGGALAAFYLVPTWIERTWIHTDAVLNDRFDLYFLFVPLSRLPMPIFCGLLWLIAFAGTSVVLWYARTGLRSRGETWNQGLTWMVLALVCFFFQLPLSAILWRHLPELRVAHLPYRFLAPVGVVAPLALLAKSTPLRWRVPGYGLLTLLALAPFGMYAMRNRDAMQNPDRLETLTEQWNAAGYQGWAQFVPEGADQPDGPTHLKPVIIDRKAGQICSARLVEEHDGQQTLETEAEEPCQIRVAKFFFPYWRAIDESGIPLPIARDGSGLLLISTPSGSHTIHLTFRAKSQARTASLIASAICLTLVLLTVYIPPRQVSFSRRSR